MSLFFLFCGCHSVGFQWVNEGFRCKTEKAEERASEGKIKGIHKKKITSSSLVSTNIWVNLLLMFRLLFILLQYSTACTSVATRDFRLLLLLLSFIICRRTHLSLSVFLSLFSAILCNVWQWAHLKHTYCGRLLSKFQNDISATNRNSK